MPRLNEVTEESMIDRKRIIELCKEPMILDELMDEIKITTNKMRFNLRMLVRDKNLTIYGTKHNKKNRKCFSYLATDSTYRPPVRKPKPVVIEIHVPKKEPVEYKPKIVQVNPYTRTVLLNEHVHHTKRAAQKICVNIGTSMSMFV
jgi:hypothetical protein